MTILSQFATSAELEAMSQECSAPSCNARADDGLRVPLCSTCARDVTYQYLGNQPKASMTPSPVTDFEEPRTRLDDPGSVYFVRLGDRIKIGFTTDLDSRMKVVPHEEILAVMPGTMRDERRCHAAFQHLRTVGEWFRVDEALLTFIARLDPIAD